VIAPPNQQFLFYAETAGAITKGAIPMV